VRLANRSQIEAVFVAGKLRLWQGWPTDWDARAFLREVDEIASEVVARAPIQRVHSAPRVHEAARHAASDAILPTA
jgi:hypothetical protein